MGDEVLDGMAFSVKRDAEIPVKSNGCSGQAGWLFSCLHSDKSHGLGEGVCQMECHWIVAERKVRNG